MKIYPNLPFEICKKHLAISKKLCYNNVWKTSFYHKGRSINHNSDEWRAKKKAATVKLRLFACLVIRILQDVSREKAMEQMFA
ncbi:MAG: hypothetical protein II333_09045, partial [Clostridia bacterium]|nr:hypothetical protein [Clostridia bacterium]